MGVGLWVGAEAVAHGGEDGHESAEAYVVFWSDHTVALGEWEKRRR